MSSDNSKLLGVVLLIRHGDRSGFYQDPTTYSATNTQITPLGTDEEFQLGTQLRGLYLNTSSPSYIQGMNTTLLDITQVQVSADSGDEGGVIFDSCVALTQGLWPPTTINSQVIANGSNTIAALGGYQYVPIDAVNSNEDVSLQGFTDCAPFDAATTAFYNSSGFLAEQAAHQAFLDDLPPYVGGRTVSLENMWNIFDFMNVQSIHNVTFFDQLPPTYLAQARNLANYHEYGVFTSPTLSGIGNIGGQTILPSILDAFSNIANQSNPIQFVYEAISYKPFISLFNMTGVAQTYPELAGIVEYAAAVAYEVRQPSSGGGPVIRMNFKNGTAASDFTTYNMFGASGDIPLSQFIDTLSPVAINTTQTWCTVCQNTQDRGCNEVALASASNSNNSHQPISPVGAGFLGAGLTLAVLGAMLAVLMFLGVLTLNRRGKKARRAGSVGSDRGLTHQATPDEKA